MEGIFFFYTPAKKLCTYPSGLVLTNCTEFRQALFPLERDLFIHESNSNVLTYENQA